MARLSSFIDVFAACEEAISNGILIHRESRQDKEFHFQNWFQARIDTLGLAYDAPKRNTYPDLRLVHYPEGFELKALAYPGREANYDSNSQIPTGLHNGRTVMYVFGRYPKGAEEADYPIIDLVMCHGDFLNIDHSYVHENKHVRAFGSYGDIMIRDRKMYVAPTPFGIADGLTGQRTLILPSDFDVDERVKPVGALTRTEAKELVIGYSFDLISNEMTTQQVENPNAGKEHYFQAYRISGATGPTVKMKS